MVRVRQLDAATLLVLEENNAMMFSKIYVCFVELCALLMMKYSHSGISSLLFLLGILIDTTTYGQIVKAEER